MTPADADLAGRQRGDGRASQVSPIRRPSGSRPCRARGATGRRRRRPRPRVPRQVQNVDGVHRGASYAWGSRHATRHPCASLAAASVPTLRAAPRRGDDASERRGGGGRRTANRDHARSSAIVEPRAGRRWARRRIRSAGSRGATTLASRYMILVPTPAGLLQVHVRVNVPQEGPRASGKLVRWNRVQTRRARDRDGGAAIDC